MRKYHTKIQAVVSEYRKQGLCSVEIAEKTGRTPYAIDVIAERAGVPFTEEEKERSRRMACEKAHITLKKQYEFSEERKEHQFEWVRMYHQEWEYISGRIFLDGQKIKVKNLVCGHEAVFASKTVRNQHSKMICPVCAEKKRIGEKIRRQKEASEKERDLEQQKSERFWSQSFTQQSVSVCPVCQSLIFDGKKYCSKECRSAFNCARHKDKRLDQIQSRNKDSITLKELYRRKCGVCYLCGGDCDFSDYETRENGVFVAGNNYPSIDHIVPLSRGGAHTWSNVELAHRICNTRKGAKVAL